MSTALPAAAFKNNGSLHLRNCAAFYGVQPHTLRVWERAGAPLVDRSAMVLWREERNKSRLEKIGRKSQRYEQKRDEIVRLYVKDRLGLRAIARYFGGRPSTAGVRKILVAAGVYRHGEALADQTARSLARREVIKAAEKEKRHHAAACLWQLRRGIPVETTCRENGWNPKSIWNLIRARASYKRFKGRVETLAGQTQLWIAL